MLENGALSLESGLSPQDTCPNPQLAKEKQKWGPVPAARHSQRVALGGKTMLEVAQNLKQVQNLQVPKPKGNKNKNSFSIFQDDKFVAIANSVGVDISDAHSTTTFTLASNFHHNCGDDNVKKNLVLSSDMSSPPKTVGNRFISSSSTSTLSLDDMVADEEVWTKVCNHRRGKHSGKCRKKNELPLLEC